MRVTGPSAAPAAEYTALDLDCGRVEDSAIEQRLTGGACLVETADGHGYAVDGQVASGHGCGAGDGCGSVIGEYD